MDYSKKRDEEAIEANKKLDNYLQITDTISDELWYSFHEAITYNSATPVNWACRKLKIIYLRTQNGESIALPIKNTALNKDNFETIIKAEFSDFIFNHILEYKL